ncbi:oxygen-independent coproporphyrinogen III oxidase [Leptospira biflexa]|uniref:oxygen-independent coproporphyrinogen III oxidase n=1 Tax=Leptospira biflexa TaxID=172 RepID=UPI001082A060|nr:oxygen-independent coproporphyrinogen III oxidase [Leptospira biflexa]TGM35051.1 oxygen-independent coproporphyrinogen III oxidase [Leptospira biflexa]TGM38515.1 oxygen-independent coproporphyrinogen III oxidase [Leptospira biflexa]TGM48054.1 oxygen-independent coproporphyrinogen III oxidase [Leptospira biflexa]TGM49481.1 oxygen-independent coproporphyrinogen III oxidase [Leptospira biflexa]TGM54748.1 oxygen-independent coproporphyrinogen III oxidase [Leptospira biflexa]
MKQLLEKYDTPAPRYTSYPTVPYWTDSPTTEECIQSLETYLFPKESKLAVYLHIPFCETLCTFCGCNTSITKNHTVEEPYVSAIQKELLLYIKNVPSLKGKELSELHLGGGSPTYLSDYNLQSTIESILNQLAPSQNPQYSIEVDPRRTRVSQLKLLRQLGFHRISLGVQDFDPEVQRLVNRIQPFELTENITLEARALGFDSVNFDLIYGLPKQSLDSMKFTIEKTLELKPDRIAFYSYAHVPWIKASQRLFTENDLPEPTLKRELYEMGRTLLEKEGYREIGMDHFALPHDKLWKAFHSKQLHRNFMGYSDSKTDVMLGLGSSAISETPNLFFQNIKLEMKYRKSLVDGIVPILRGHKLTNSDQLRKELILQLMTSWEVKVPNDLQSHVRQFLTEMEKDNLVNWQKDTLVVTETGKPFLRIVAMAFDEKLQLSQPTKPVFSKAI